MLWLCRITAVLGIENVQMIKKIYILPYLMRQHHCEPISFGNCFNIDYVVLLIALQILQK